MKHKVIEFIGNIGDGGAETLVKDYGLMLDQDKFEAEIVTIYKPNAGANFERLKNSHIKIISVYNSHNKLTNVCKVLFGWAYIPLRLSKIFKEEKPEIIHTHLTILRYLKPIKKQLQGIKLFYTCHCPPSMMLCGKRANEGKAARELIKSNGLRLIALHNEMREELDKMFGVTNTVVLHNGVDFSKFGQVKENKAEIRKNLGVPIDAFVVGHIGRFSYQKNQLFLLDVFKCLCEKQSNAFLLMIGHGELEDEVKTKILSLGIEEKTLILSHRTDIPQIIKTMDVFVFPSRFEGLSVTMVEVQASGVKCVVSNKVNEETILSENTLIAGENENPEHWCDLILSNEHNPNHGSLDDFDMNKEIKHLENIYLGIN